MKLYKNAIAEMKVKGCNDCPHRIPKVYKGRNGGYYTLQVCSAITMKAYNHILCKPVTHHLYPCVADAINNGSYLPECPLPEAGEGDKK
ncbi:MAG: hypothetical protein PHC50_03500 [Candidatus Cloacimonetes bacterium]|nr:hypothetical protein [Candidatus Cloacimonadota bacterium]